MQPNDRTYWQIMTCSGVKKEKCLVQQLRPLLIVLFAAVKVSLCVCVMEDKPGKGRRKHIYMWKNLAHRRLDHLLKYKKNIVTKVVHVTKLKNIIRRNIQYMNILTPINKNGRIKPFGMHFIASYEIIEFFFGKCDKMILAKSIILLLSHLLFLKYVF